MQTANAKQRSTCDLCPVQIKPGQRIAIWFDTNDWVHLGCMIREYNAKVRAEAG